MKKSLLCYFCIFLSFVLFLAGCSNSNDSSEITTESSVEPSESSEVSEESSFVFEELNVDFPTKTVMKTPEVGDVFEFGSYPQGSDGTVKPIKWIILDIQEGEALILSKYCLACQPFDQSGDNPHWEDCSLRSWLNNEFYNEAFNSDEQSLIIESTISTALDADGYEHYDTLDNVFLLSKYEATHYLKPAYTRCCDPTEYIIADINAYAYTLFLENAPSKAGIPYPGCDWWLRSPEEECNNVYASIICHDGRLAMHNVRDRDIVYDVEGVLLCDEYRSDVAVRPALRVNLDTITQTVYSDEQLSDETSVVINEVNFPDKNLRNIISDRFDEDSNGILVCQEIKSANYLDLKDADIYSLDGLDNLRYLKRLDISSNHISGTVDMSCFYLLETFIFEKNKEENPISLVFGNNPYLRFLICNDSNVESLNVSSCENLELLICENNILTDLELSICTHLKKLYCYSNYLSNIDLSTNSELLYLAYSGFGGFIASEEKANKVSKLDLSHCSGLKVLYVPNCDIEELNISGCKNLRALDVSGNKGIFNSFTDISFENLTSLYCDNTGLKFFDFKLFPAVRFLSCTNNELTALDISSTEIESLDCSNNNISSLTLNSIIWELDCHNNNLDYLDFSCLEHSLVAYCYNNGPITICLGDLESFYSGADAWNENHIADYERYIDNDKVYSICESVWMEVTTGEIIVDLDAKFTY